MNTVDDTYSRFVAWTKVILPLIALAILSTLFLFSRQNDQEQRIPYAKVEVEELAREQGISAPNYAGVTADGAAISISASSARPDPDNPSRLTASNLSAVIQDKSGGRIDITAAAGVIDTDNKFVSMRGGVQIITSTGFTISTSGVVAALDETAVITDGRVVAQGPLGTLSAGRMELRRTDTDSQQNLLVFKDGVKLVYSPKG